jgi:parallel beta-helix repeat protein
VDVKPGIYTLADMKGSGAIQIEADGVTIDFHGATLQSPSEKSGRQETYNGIGVAINGHKKVTIRNAHINGFQYNVKATNCSGLILENCELGQSRSQKIVDNGISNNIWLDLRGFDSWHSYGAGAWLEGCSLSTVKGVRANQSQNGLILVKSNSNRIVGCDFSYNSGWGIALCRSSDNLICWNHADFVNRPWAGGWGGDSSGVVLTTQSNRNIWAFNSFTHGGDGFFLATLNGGFDDQGKLHADGPCDGNWVLRNDGSWSTANAFESTFSTKNIFYRNIADDSNYGFWLGYSNRNIVDGNEINRSHVDGIAHEQGAKCVYVGNDIEDTGESAIHLWGGKEPKFKQSPSTENFFARNKIVRAKRGFELNNSTQYTAQDNVLESAPVPPGFHQTKGAGTDDMDVPRKAEIMSLKPKGFRMYRGIDLPKGWQWLAASPYGMRDYRKMVVPWTMKDARTLRLYVRPKVIKVVDIPTWMVVFIDGKQPNEWLVSAKPNSDAYGEYRDFKFDVVAQDGTKESIEGKLLDLQWHVRWFKWFRNDHNAFADTSAWNALFAGPALKEEDLPDLPNIPGYKAPEPGLPVEHFALTATTKIKLDGGRYRFDTVSDDGIEVIVDGHSVVRNWTHHGATQDSGTINLLAGIHHIEVHYCQEDGGAALSVHWARRSG